MARIRLEDLRHSYLSAPSSDADYALKRIDLEWDDGGAYALLGPSGCGKTTLLNLISGLLKPTQGRILFDETDVTDFPPDARNIAQVFQFPVIYDTMTVRGNLEFPLRNRGVPAPEIRAQVKRIAGMLELEPMLERRASGLSADGKQKISLGRGLVRSDVNVIMFDEPLTVIDPHLKWKLRSQLKALHQSIRRTMIYVTHDQTEALTFADKVVVMHDGAVVQIGTPVELFERPAHTFVGHFIGSPGMNLLPCELLNGAACFDGLPIVFDGPLPKSVSTHLEFGVRPEFIQFAEEGIPVDLIKVNDTGRHRIVETRHRGRANRDSTIKLLVPEGEAIPANGQARIALDPTRTRLYDDGWLVQAQP